MAVLPRLLTAPEVNAPVPFAAARQPCHTVISLRPGLENKGTLRGVLILIHFENMSSSLFGIGVIDEDDERRDLFSASVTSRQQLQVKYNTLDSSPVASCNIPTGAPLPPSFCAHWKIQFAMATHNSIFSLALLASASIATLGSTCRGLQFSYPSFDKTNKDDFSFSPVSGIADGSLQITPNSGDITDKSGRVCYNMATLKLWAAVKQKRLTSFRTNFVLSIPPQPQNKTGEGMAFILTNNPSLPPNSSGQWLGITNEQTDNSTVNRVVAVEFDTRKNYQEDLDDNHIGLDVNSIKSVAQYPLSNVSIFLASGFDLSVSISYRGEFRLLIVEAMQLSAKGLHVVMQAWPIDLSQYLLEDIYVGFAGSTGEFTELNQIKSWKFITIDEDDSVGRSVRIRKVSWFLFISLLCVCAVFAICVRRRSQQGRRLAYDRVEMMKDVSSV